MSSSFDEDEYHDNPLEKNNHHSSNYSSSSSSSSCIGNLLLRVIITKYLPKTILYISFILYFLFITTYRMPLRDPIIGLSVPLLITSSIAYLCFTREHHDDGNKDNGVCTTITIKNKVTATQQATATSLFRPPSCSYIRNPCFLLKTRGGGDPNYTTIILITIILPSTIYISKSLHDRQDFTKLHSFQDLFTLQSKFYHQFNNFGRLSVMSMSWFLIPVSRHSILLNLLGWNPIHATKLHIVSGYVALFGGIVHSMGWILIFVYNNNNNNSNDSWMTTLSQLLRVRVNLTGFIAMISFLFLSLTSINIIRRHHYKVFYICHIIFGSGLLMGLLIHWNDMIIYLAPSLLYYCATTFGPLMVEYYIIPFLVLLCGCGPLVVCHDDDSSSVEDMIDDDGVRNNGMTTTTTMRMTKTDIPEGNSNDSALSTRNQTKKTRSSNSVGGVEITNVKHIPQSNGCVELSFAIDTHVRENLESIPSQYVKIHVPDVSSLWFPFTVFPSHDNSCMNIMFRSTGNFTCKLKERLQLQNHGIDDTMRVMVEGEELDPQLSISSTSSYSFKQYPKIRIDGFYSGTNYLDQALYQHDTVIMMAGGIGITPYLSLTKLLLTSLVHNSKQRQNDGTLMTKKVVLHWFCRDEGLIRHVVKNYFNPLLVESRSRCSFRQKNRHTCSTTNHAIDEIMNDDEENKENQSSFGKEEGKERIQFHIVIHHTAPNEEDSIEEEDSTITTNDDHHQKKKSFGKPFSLPILYSTGHRTRIQHNIPSFLIFSTIAWGGLYLISYCYHNIHTKPGAIASRYFSTVLVILWSLMIPLIGSCILNCITLFTPSSSCCCCCNNGRRKRRIRKKYDRVFSEQNDLNLETETSLSFVDDTTTTTTTITTTSGDLSNDENNGLRKDDDVVESTLKRSTSLNEEEKYKQGTYNPPLSTNKTNTSLPPTQNYDDSDDNKTKFLINCEIIHCQGRPVMNDILEQDLIRSHQAGIFVCGPQPLIHSIKNIIWSNFLTRLCKVNGRAALYEEAFET